MIMSIPFGQPMGYTIGTKYSIVFGDIRGANY